MNSKDYKAIAEIIKEEWAGLLTLRSEIASKFADNLEIRATIKLEKRGKNPQIETMGFNRQQFLKDCGIGE